MRRRETNTPSLHDAFFYSNLSLSSPLKILHLRKTFVFSPICLSEFDFFTLKAFVREKAYQQGSTHLRRNKGITSVSQCTDSLTAFSPRMGAWSSNTFSLMRYVRTYVMQCHHIRIQITTGCDYFYQLIGLSTVNCTSCR